MKIKKFRQFIKAAVNENGLTENVSDKNHNIECVSTETLNQLRTQSKSDYNYDLEKSIEDNGIINPLLIVYHVHDNKAALSDGHNRLDVAINLGIKCLPTKVIISGTDAPMNAKEVTVPNWKGKDEINPSEIGLF